MQTHIGGSSFVTLCSVPPVAAVLIEDVVRSLTVELWHFGHNGDASACITPPFQSCISLPSLLLSLARKPAASLVDR